MSAAQANSIFAGVFFFSFSETTCLNPNKQFSLLSDLQTKVQIPISPIHQPFRFRQYPCAVVLYCITAGFNSQVFLTHPHIDWLLFLQYSIGVDCKLIWGQAKPYIFNLNHICKRFLRLFNTIQILGYILFHVYGISVDFLGFNFRFSMRWTSFLRSTTVFLYRHRRSFQSDDRWSGS